MKLISLRCRCGATFYFNDREETYINPDHSPDPKGRLYRIELLADRWQDRHRVCLSRPLESRRPPETPT